MPEFTIEVPFEVVCAKCGNGLCRQSDASSHKGQNSVTVEPCEKCLDESYDKGFRDGENSNV